MNAWRRSAAISSFALYVSSSSTLKFFFHAARIHAARTVLYKTGPLSLSSTFLLRRECARSLIKSLPLENLQRNHETDYTPYKQNSDRNPVRRKRRAFVHQGAEHVVERG
jgi:hypothetical protein